MKNSFVKALLVAGAASFLFPMQASALTVTYLGSNYNAGTCTLMFDVVYTLCTANGTLITDPKETLVPEIDSAATTAAQCSAVKSSSSIVKSDITLIDSLFLPKGVCGGGGKSVLVLG